MEVIVRNDFEKSLTLFKRKSIPILKELRDRRGYLKPSEKRKRKSRRAAARLRKEQKKERGNDDFRNETAPWFKFIYYNDELHKVMIPRKEREQANILK